MNIVTDLKPHIRRLATKPFFLPLQFRAPLPNWVAVGSTPNIYHLVELKDTYDRFVVTLPLCKERPERRKRMGREWTRAHDQSHLGCNEKRVPCLT